MNRIDKAPDVNRRAFLKGSSIMMMMGGIAIKAADEKAPAADAPAKKPSSPPVKCGVIGCGPWGRDVVQILGRMPNAPVVAISDLYSVFAKRAAQEAPNAKTYIGYQELLKNPDVEAVIIATPTHTHKEIVAAAIAAGKHIYCEAPLAHTVAEAREIALLSRKNPKIYFQTGLQMRSDPEVINIKNFVEAGAMGRTIRAQSQYNKKQSWRRSSSDSEREKMLNWRLDKQISPGLVGEIGIHSIDQAAWFLRSRPVAVTGFGDVVHWKDGREVPDSIQVVFEFPGGVLASYSAMLGNSFDGSYDMFYGTDAAIMMRDRKSWMFKEVDSPLLGWEVYARKETFHKETGIVLAANATKQASHGDNPLTSALTHDSSSLFYALEAFITNAYMHKSAVEDFEASFDSADTAALAEYLVDINKNKVQHATVEQGYEANLMALKANEAVLQRKRIEFDPNWFTLS
ncbi:MAG: Gfo/Idh/MocA family oxidoreductase [Verrucomicrobiota bacterium]|nr:Gfo/Idh/MocA family oxidoreductase [Verrucomicrobiota bacterium]